MGQLVMLSVGSAGVRIGHQTCKRIAGEHQVNSAGQKQCNGQGEIYKDSIVFSENSDGRRTPLSVFADTEGDTVDEVRSGEWRDLFWPGGLVSGKEGAAGNYIRGHYTIGREVSHIILQQGVRRVFEKCDNYAGMIVNCSMGGGTGSGLTANLIQRLSVNSLVNKKTMILNMVTPSPQMSNCVIEPYNFMLGFSDINSMAPKNFAQIAYDNQQIYKLCQTQSDIEQPSYHEINNYIAKAITLYTNRLRLSQQPESFHDFCTNTVPYPKINLLTPHIQQFTSVVPSPQTVLSQLYSYNNAMHSYGTSPHSILVASFAMLRGEAQRPEVLDELWRVREQLNFVRWVPTGVKVSISGKKIETPALQGIVLNNNCSTLLSLLRNVTKKWDQLYAKRAFVHWLVGQGLSEGFMGQARQNCEAYIRDYEELTQSNDALEQEVD